MNTNASVTNQIWIYLIIFLAVTLLPSLNGPVVSDLMDRSDRSRVKAQLYSLKTAFISYRSDLRHLPFAGDNPNDSTAYSKVWKYLYADNSAENILLSSYTPEIQGRKCTLAMNSKQYKARWKGPYLFYETPADSLIDAWGNPIAYYCIDEGKSLSIFLHSAGEDGIFDMARPELASFSEELKAYQSFSLSRIFNFGGSAIADAHSSNYEGDDLIIQIDRIKKRTAKL